MKLLNVFRKLPVENSKSGKKKFKLSKLVKVLVVIVIIGVVGKIGIDFFMRSRLTQIAAQTVIQTAKVERRDIQKILSSSGTIEPLNTYDVTTLVKGEVIAANIEAGSQVEEGDILYQIATDDLDGQIDIATTSVTRAEKEYSKAVKNYEKVEANYKTALKDYEEAAKEYSDLNIVSTASGIVKEVFVEVGDTVQSGSQIAQVYDNSYMLLDVPFNSTQVSTNMVGKTCEVEVNETYDTIDGVVTKVSGIDEVLTGNQVVRRVTIKVANPGGLTTSNTATATIDDVSSSGDGTFSLLEESIIKATKSGEISSITIEKGSSVYANDIVVVLSSENIDEQLESYNNKVESTKESMENAAEAVESALDSIDDANTTLDDVIDTRTDYSVKAPISGQIIKKNSLVGDTITSNTALCVIYDLSAVTFTMYVDELDVLSVKVDQKVDITADAIDDVEFSGVVTNISLVSTTSGGVTQYPVTVRINDTGDLLPGMNVTGEIIIEKVENVIAIPSEALMRGDVVYVADETVTEATGNVPAGFKSVKVTTGLTDGDYLEILSGLNGDEEVYIIRTSGTEQINMMPGGGFNKGPGGGFSGNPGGGFGGSQGGSQGGSMGGSMDIRP